MGISCNEELTVIVGGGITGLTAAFSLAKAGEKCLLLEKEEAVGGECRSFVLDDIVFDLGPHVLLLSPDSEADSFLLSLLDGEDVIRKKGNIAFYAKGRYWSFPPSIIEGLMYPWEYKIQILSSLFFKRTSADRRSLRAFIEGKAGTSFYRDIFAGYVLKKTSLTGDKIHREWFIRPDRDIFQHKEPPPEKFSPLRHWYYPEKGFGIIAGKLYKAFCDAGGTAMFNCGDIKLENTGDFVRSISAGDKKYAVKNLIWTASVNLLNNLLSGTKLSVKADFIDTVFVMLTFNRKKRVSRPYIYAYQPEEDIIFNRIYFPGHIYGEKRFADKEGICLEINYYPNIGKLSNDEILKRAVGDLEKLGFFSSNALREFMIIRLNECMPVYELDYEEQVDRVFSAVRSYKNLYSVGRNGGYYFCQTPAAVSQGLKVSKHILQQKYKPEQ